MRSPQSACERRVEILFSVSVKVMASVVRRPPERSFLIGRRTREREQELKNPASLISAVREETMKSGGNCKHSHNVKNQAGNDCHCAYARPDDEQARDVHEEKLYADGVI